METITIGVAGGGDKAAIKAGRLAIRQCEIHEELQIGRSTFLREKSAGRFGPQPRVFAGSVLYDREEVRAWLSSPGPDGKLLDARSWPAKWAAIRASQGRRGA